MDYNDLSLGQVVCSMAGRDKGRFFIVVEVVDEDYVRICDGDLRKFHNPKLKKIKHLKKTNYIDDKIRDLLERSQKLSDAEIRRSLEDYHKIP